MSNPGESASGMAAILVTGSSGLVGYQVAARLHAAGRDVLGFDARPPPERAPFPAVTGDVTELPAVLHAMSGRAEIVHAGAISGPMLLLDDPFSIARTNVDGALAVFEAARRSGVRRLVWLSSIAVYGDQPTLDPVPETASPNPRSFYGHTKVAGEAMLRAYNALYGLDAVALRLSSVYGVRRQTACALTGVIQAGLHGRAATVPADGSSFRQYIHVEDAASAVISALAAEHLPRLVYNITGNTYVTEAQIARMLRKLLPCLLIEHGPAAWNEGHLGPLITDPAAAEFGFRPSVSLEHGLAELHSYISAEHRA